MMTQDLTRKEPSIEECFERLECLFKNSQGSDYNYQLLVSNSPFNTLKRLVMWQPMENYFDKQHDWVLVQFEEKDTGFRLLPHVAEFRTIDNKWHTDADDKAMDNYINDMCKPIAFRELLKKES